MDTSSTGATRRIVVGVDGSDSSGIALRRAAEEATAHGGRLEIVHAWNFLDQPSGQFDAGYNEQKAREHIEAFVEATLQSARPADTSVILVNDHPSPALIDTAAGAYTLVVGARGLGGFRGLVLGSVSQHLVHNAPCPVLIIR